MAAPPQVPTVPNTPLLNEQNEDEDTNGQRLPSGPCNYRNLSVGGNVPKCGCRRFTDKALELHGLGGQLRPGWCICEHHSCYHSHDPVDGPRVLADVSVTGGMSLTPKPSMYRQSLTPRGEGLLQDENPEVGRLGRDSVPDTLQWSRYLNSEPGLGSLPAIPSQCLLPSDNGSRASSSQTGNIRPFAGLGLNTLSHIPKRNTVGPASLNPKGQLLPGSERRMQVFEDSAGHPFLQSLTEVATPSLQSSQDLDAGVVFNKNVAEVQDALQRLTEDKDQGIVALMPSEDNPDSHTMAASKSGRYSDVVEQESNDENMLPRIRSIIDHVADYPTKIQNHEQRLDLLENTSFSYSAIDEVQENHGYLETRVEELETRVDDIEKAQAAQSDGGSFGGRQQLDGSTDTPMTNTSSALIAAAMDRIDYGRIEALEAQILELQSTAPPSYTRPWEVEVVFLPFGHRLMGIWSTKHSTTPRSKRNSTAGEDGTQAQNNSMAVAQAQLTAHHDAVAWDTSVKALTNQDDAFLMPRACGLRSRIGERLRSRGLIKLLQVRGPDARDVQAAMLSAFGDLPITLAEDPYSHHHRSHQPVPDSLTTSLGLQASWVPLRKLHKDDRLQFLNASEMITPALWTVQFLSSSVAMRAPGTRRLYVTQPDSYIQHLRDENAEWTWQKLRQLPRVYPDAQSSFGHTPEADAHEPCWEFDDRLDSPLSVNSSFASHHSSLSIRPVSYEAEASAASPSDHVSSAAASPVASTTPTSVAPPPGRPISPLKDRHPFRPIHSRTISMPSLIPIQSSPSQIGIGKRRIASFEHEAQAHSSPTSRAPSALNLKRRRISRSPSHPADTPRWSVGPPSPYTFVEDIVERNKRPTTPFAYATPHSNAPYVEASRGVLDDDESEEQGSATDVDADGEGYDQNALSDYDSEESDGNLGHQPEEEWEGMQDDESKVVGKVVDGFRQVDGDDDDEGSDDSSQPSEYPSRQPAEMSKGNSRAGFKIHVDEEVDDAY